MTRIILGDLCLELAAKTNFRQKQLFVYKSLFTLLGHMTNFVVPENLTRLIYALKRPTRRFLTKVPTIQQQFKELEVRAMLART